MSIGDEHREQPARQPCLGVLAEYAYVVVLEQVIPRPRNAGSADVHGRVQLAYP